MHRHHNFTNADEVYEANESNSCGVLHRQSRLVSSLSNGQPDALREAIRITARRGCLT
jgi:hypothetical protein